MIQSERYRLIPLPRQPLDLRALAVEFVGSLPAIGLNAMQPSRECDLYTVAQAFD